MLNSGYVVIEDLNFSPREIAHFEQYADYWASSYANRGDHQTAHNVRSIAAYLRTLRELVGSDAIRKNKAIYKSIRRGMERETNASSGTRGVA